MERLPESLLLQILSRLDDSADVARCRVASKAFNAVFPGLRSINLRCSKEWYVNSRSRVSSCKPFMAVFIDLISELDSVESVCISHEDPVSVLLANDLASDDLYLHNMYVEEWLPRVSESLKSISLSGAPYSKVLPLISAYCHNLVNLNLNYAWLPVANLNPMPMLTSLTLEFAILEDQHLTEFNRCFPNLRVLNLVRVGGLQDPKIHLLNLQTCYWAVYNHPPSLTLIAPNLITLEIEIECPAVVHVEAPVLSHFHLRLNTLKHAGAFNVKKFENLKTLCLVSLCLGSLLSEFPITKTVETLTLDSENEEPRDTTDSDLTLRKVFMVFPNVSSLCIYPSGWWELEACLNPEGWEILDGRKGLKTICAYLDLVDPAWTFSSLFCVLYQCVGLSQVSLLIHCDVVDTESKSFMSKCMDRWPGLKWRWGIWGEDMEDSWITDGISN